VRVSPSSTVSNSGSRPRPLDAIERWYPYDRPVDSEPVTGAIDRYGLLATGGSDAHDDRLGVAGLGEAAWERVRAAIV